MGAMVHVYYFLGIEGQTVPQLRVPPCVCRNLLGILLCEWNPFLTNSPKTPTTMGFLMAEQYSFRQSLLREYLADCVAERLRLKKKARQSSLFGCICNAKSASSSKTPRRVTIEMGVVYINSLCLCDFLPNCGARLVAQIKEKGMTKLY